MTARSTHPGCECIDRDFCQWAAGCWECRPDSWRSWRIATRAPCSHEGASFEAARKSLKHLAAYYRELADSIDQAHADGFRLYDVSDSGLIHAAKGRVKT